MTTARHAATPRRSKHRRRLDRRRLRREEFLAAAVLAAALVVTLVLLGMQWLGDAGQAVGALALHTFAGGPT